MFSTRFVVVCGFAFLVAATAFPASEKAVITQSITDDELSFPWMSISPFSLFAPLWKLIPSFADIGPRIYNDKKQMQIVVNVKDYKKEDLKVTVKPPSIFVQGSQEANNNNRDVFATQFYHTYSLPSNSSSSVVTAKLTADGFLVVTAPISEDLENSENIDREVPIVETGAPYRRELPVEPAADSVPTEAVETTQAPTTESTTTQAPSTKQEPTTTQTPTTAQSSTTTTAPTESEVTSTPAPITNPQPTNSQAPTTTTSPVSVAEEEVNELLTTPIDQEDATEKDNVIPHGNEVIF